MTLSRALRKATTGLALLLPGTALAGTVVVTPMVPIHGVKAERLQDLFTLMSSELEFMEGVDEVVELDAPPASLTLSCLDSTKCLGALAKENGGDMLLTGAVEERGTELLLDLVFYDVAKNRVVRRKTSTIPSDASKLIDRINPLLVEAVTGRAPAQAKVDAVSAADFGDDGDELELEPTPAPTIEPAPAPAPPKTTSSTRAVDQKIVAPPPPAPKPEPPPAEEEGAVFTFGGDVDDISFGDTQAEAPSYEEEEEVVEPRRTTSSRPAPAPVVEEEEEFEAPPPRRLASDEEEVYDPYDPDEVDAEDDEPVRDLDADRPSRASSAKSGKGSTGYRRVHIPLRVGYAHYGDFHFLSVGGEIQVRAAKGLFIGIGAEPYFAKVCSTPPDNYAGAYANPAVCGKEGLYIRTVPLFPLNAGLLYRFLDKAVQPYVGADVVFANIGRADVYGDGVQRLTFAGGGRLRVGADFFVVKNFGFNIDAALGFWTGRGWQFVIEPRAQPTAGFLPRVSAGITLAF
jgi:hypothetical protein